LLLAILADIHGNLEAFRACLDHARGCGAERLVLLGDLVGYGADPEAVVDIAMAEAAAGALILLGNHDQAVATGATAGMNEAAAAAIAWTRARLDEARRDFLAGLPLIAEAEGCLFVHADASAPARWRYVTDAEAAERSLAATAAQVTVCGHVHRPALYSQGGSGRITAFHPVPGVAVPLSRGRRWLAVMGAVGQPRDGNPAACYGLFDTASREMTWQRVPYDIAAAAAKIRAAGLPERLADRLFVGR
jgi:diadenosine tetraphosphatase ApaH/serine/threonine PP2A family protein phosphatase